MAFTKEQQKMMSQLLELDGAVVHGDHDPFASGIYSPSPSFGFCFDNTWCLPDGYTLLLGGEPKGGKSLIVSSLFGQLHKDDPDAVVMKFNTEFRERAQVTPAQLRLWGIDTSRYIAYDTNIPNQIFDRLEQQVPKMIEAGIKLRCVAIDSVNDILGRRAINAEGVDTQQIGDSALTLQDGFKRIKGILRKNNVSLILTCQIRAEMDRTEQMRGHTTKFATSFYVKHLAEYFMLVERLQTKAGRTDLAGNEFKDESRVDLTGQNRSDGDEIAHKIRVTMRDSSLGRPGRVGVFTIHHDLGIINTHEEVYLLGIGMGVLNRAGAGNHTLNSHDALSDKLKSHLDKTWRGKEAMLTAIRDNPDLYKGILETCKAIDLDRKNGIIYNADGKRNINPQADTINKDSDVLE